MRLRNQIPVVCFGLLVVILGVGCASTQQETSSEDEANGTEACFNVRDTRSFTALHNRFVYVEGSRNEHYLLTMINACLDLEHALGINITNDFNRICSGSGAWITYQRFGKPARCTILKVESVKDLDSAKKTVQQRTTPAGEKEN